MDDQKKLIEAINKRLPELDSEELQMVLRYIYALEDLR